MGGSNKKKCNYCDFLHLGRTVTFKTAVPVSIFSISLSYFSSSCHPPGFVVYLRRGETQTHETHMGILPWYVIHPPLQMKLVLTNFVLFHMGWLVNQQLKSSQSALPTCVIMKPIVVTTWKTVFDACRHSTWAQVIVEKSRNIKLVRFSGKEMKFVNHF